MTAAALEASLLAALEPLVRRIVQGEMRRERERWRWASVGQAAERLDTTPAAIYSRVQRGQLPYRKLDGRLYIDMHATSKLIEAGV